MIRKFKNRDMEQVIKIWLEASILAYHFVAREYWESKVADMRDFYIPNDDAYVYEEDKTVKIFIALHENTVAAVFVSPDSQMQGIGVQLINKAKTLFSCLKLTVYEENFNGIQFYQKYGFRDVGEQIDENTGHPEMVLLFP